jgi:transmembrane sensor
VYAKVIACMLTSSRKNEFIELLRKYQQQKASPKEVEFLEQYYRYFDQEEKTSLGLSSQELAWLENRLFRDIERILEARGQALQPAKRRIITMRRVAAAAIILLLLGTASYEWSNSSNKTPIRIANSTQRFKNDIAPGTEKAVLTLANGSKIILDSAHNGVLGQQGKTKILKFSGGELAYLPIDLKKDKIESPVTIYNIVSTPRGGQYQVILADGSKVWLNAASSLRFPTSFVGNKRTVELTGEAYFEVAKNPKMPFTVHIALGPASKADEGMDVHVLGTHFNINAYDDELAVKTTLLEGSVKITKGDESTFLEPGNQSLVDRLGNMKFVAAANVDEAVAWKNGMFNFKSADIETIMRQISRWYDVNIVYQKNVNERFYAEISRNTNVSNIFKMLELTGGVHFNIEGKKIIVGP